MKLLYLIGLKKIETQVFAEPVAVDQRRLGQEPNSLICSKVQYDRLVLYGNRVSIVWFFQHCC